MDRTDAGAALVGSLLCLGVSGCLTDAGPDAGGELDESEAVIEGPNALLPNALVPNALVPNALVPNALVPNALSPSTIVPSALEAIQDPTETGDLSRALLKYTVSCALSPSQSFSFTWTDSQGLVHKETYPGIVGLASSWAMKPLGEADQEWVSACLASRVNWYGVTVMISSRGSHPALHKSDPSETKAYTMIEGAFWGNVFAAKPRAYACFYGPNRPYSRAQRRDCAAGHVEADGTISECGIIEIVGPCEAQCQPFKGQGQYYPSCTGPMATTSSAVLTTFLL
jgi:hypothetical protein